MKHYGEFPPWDGEAKFGLTWLPGETLWDGSVVWTLTYRGSAVTVATLSEILKTHYMPGLMKLMNEPSVFDFEPSGGINLTMPKYRTRRVPLWRRLRRVMRAYFFWPLP